MVNTNHEIDTINLNEIIRSYLKHWKWFVFSVFVCLGFAMVYLRYAKPKFMSTAKIQILEEDGNGGLDLFNDIDLFSISKNNVLDEIEIIKSRSNLLELTNKLKLNTRIFEVGNVIESEIYKNTPINLNFIGPDSLINKSEYNFYITIQSNINFGYAEEKDLPEISYSFGKNIQTPLGDIVITPNLRLFSSYVGKTIKVSVSPIDLVAGYLKENIEIVENDDSNILNLYFKDGSPQKGRDILNELIHIYNQNAILDKTNIADKTAKFINERITDIASSLESADDSTQTLRSSRGIVNSESQANINLNAGVSNRQDLANMRNQLNIASSMSNLVNQQEGFGVLPANVGLSDATVASTAARYNQLVQERNRLLKSSNPKNPVIINLDGELNGLKKTLSASLNSTVDNLGLTVNTLSSQQAIINSQIYSAPKNERDLRDITRKQQTSESLYLYLLQKREEAQIAAVSTSPKSKVVDFATSGIAPVAPRRMVILLAGFIFGILIPFSILYVYYLLDTKVSNMKNVEAIANNIPILGELPKVPKKLLNAIVMDDRSVFSESMRMIRTNLDYLVKTKREPDLKNNLIFVSSSIPGEGKTFVSSNLSMILAGTKKKVLLIGSDIRNPKIHSFFTGQNIDRIANGKEKIKDGLTEYLVDDTIEMKSIISTMLVQENEIDIIYSGRIPPNPSELLMSDRMGALFKEASEAYDYVIVDTAPLMVVTDTLLLTKYANHLIYVTRAGKTEKKALEYPIKLQNEGKLSGLTFIVNGVSDAELGYGGLYSYGYGKMTKKWWSF
jgi:tyrosine-protein kinase Etk/Wzc